MQKLKYALVVLATLSVTACNITQVPLSYCPASTYGAYATHSLKVGQVYDDRVNEGNITNDPREIGEFSWKQSIAPNIYYGLTPITNTVQTTLHMSLAKAGYKLTSIHPDRILYTRFDKIDLHLEGKDNTSRTLYCGINTNFAVTDQNDKVLWRKTIRGEGSVVVPSNCTSQFSCDDIHKRYVQKVVYNALDDLVLQLERSQGFNRVLR